MTNKLEYSWVYTYHSIKRCCCVCLKKKIFSKTQKYTGKNHIIYKVSR